MAGIGRPIEARLGARTVSGRFEAVDAEGRLVLRTSAGLERIAAGDVFFAE
jgi:BirA family biotin operon repressor/biotin-[acetyl-CoA-carboxylase] ligase